MSAAIMRRASLLVTLALVLIVAVGACDSPTQPRALSPSPTPTPTPSRVTLSGQLFAVTPAGRMPAPSNLSVVLTLIEGNCPAVVCRTVISSQSTTAGPDGRYQFANLPLQARILVHAGAESSYRQLCGASAILSSDTQLDVDVTPTPHLPSSPTSLVVTGQIYETTPVGRAAISDASLGIEYLFPDVPFVNAQVDKGGRYVACGIPNGTRVAFWTGATGFEDTYVWHTFTSNATLDIELKRD